MLPDLCFYIPIQRNFCAFLYKGLLVLQVAKTMSWVRVFCHLSLATETGEFLSLTREFIVYEGDTQIVRISTGQLCMPKYNVILFIRSRGSQMNSAHFDSTSAAMTIMTLL